MTGGFSTRAKVVTSIPLCNYSRQAVNPARRKMVPGDNGGACRGGILTRYPAALLSKILTGAE